MTLFVICSINTAIHIFPNLVSYNLCYSVFADVFWPYGGIIKLITETFISRLLRRFSDKFHPAKHHGIEWIMKPSENAEP